MFMIRKPIEKKNILKFSTTKGNKKVSLFQLIKKLITNLYLQFKCQDAIVILICISKQINVLSLVLRLNLKNLNLVTEPPNNRFQLSVGSNLETLNTISSGTYLV